MKRVIVIIIILTISACTQVDSNHPTFYKGVWWEQSGREDVCGDSLAVNLWLDGYSYKKGENGENMTCFYQ